jgi:Ca2+-binding RTX toxin-like protein
MIDGRPLFREENMATIFSTASNIFVEGTEDSDTIVARGDNDTVFGYRDNDLVFVVGDSHVIYGDSPLTGGPHAGTGDDTLVGGPGNDTVWGGAGADTMAGGPSADMFNFGWVPQARGFVLDTTDFQGNNDLIVDFNPHEGDRIDLTGYLGQGQSGVFRGTEAFTDDAVLQVRYDVQDNETVVQIRVPLPFDPPGPAVTGEIGLAGVLTLMETDFFLAG